MSTAVPGTKGKSTRVLVIDDNPQDVVLLEEVLATHGSFEITAVHNGRRGLELIEKPELLFDLILVDWRIPEVPGDQIASAYLRNPARVSPLVVLSSAIPSRIRKDLVNQGAIVLEKPMDLKGYESLAERLAALVQPRTC
jgi:CheY-like chemotaxis protein